MFSKQEKMKIAQAIEDVLLEIDHPEMPKENPKFEIHIVGKESWSWADVIPNWCYSKDCQPATTAWNEKARVFMKESKEDVR